MYTEEMSEDMDIESQSISNSSKSLKSFLREDNIN